MGVSVHIGALSGRPKDDNNVLGILLQLLPGVGVSIYYVLAVVVPPIFNNYKASTRFYPLNQ